ncbi:hypothetical protein DdX_18098 [Ditylenchus destructor]|uniref:Uncharacterized protein n=1 Tax=Ditylenchus destructor TaxID=166010 RepID=A0AAD4MLV1_9BILA|nr:hypothetical protein DdX_18098 [Ditylenchus destructor]
MNFACKILSLFLIGLSGLVCARFLELGGIELAAGGGFLEHDDFYCKACVNNCVFTFAGEVEKCGYNYTCQCRAALEEIGCMYMCPDCPYKDSIMKTTTENYREVLYPICQRNLD